jgi:hypothetical protein
MSESIRNIANTKILLTKEEFQYYESLSKIFGAESFVGLFQTNNSGCIIQVSPSLQKVTPVPIIYFLLNVSFNQRMRRLDSFIDKVDNMERRIKKMEDKINNSE